MNVNSLMDGFCSDVLREAEATEAMGFPSGSQDLFMEQGEGCNFRMDSE